MLFALNGVAEELAAESRATTLESGQKSRPLADAENVSDSDQYPEEPVILEVRPYVWDPKTREYRIPHYKYRRDRFGIYGQVGIVQYRPEIVRRQKTVMNDTTQYNGTVPSTMDVQISPRLSTRLGTISLDLGYSEYNIRAVDGSSANLFASMPRAGLTILLDTIWDEPYFVPYIFGGAFQAQYNQRDARTGRGDSKISGPSGFYGAGALIQLNWLDMDQSGIAYDEIGLENTFLFVEHRAYLSTSAGAADFGSESNLAGGLRLEF